MITLLDKQQALNLYTNRIQKDFGKDEIPPFLIYEENIQNEKYQAYFYQEDKIEKAYIIARQKEEYVLVLFFAVFEEQRGLGIGTKAIQELKEYFKDKKAIIIEVENEQATTSNLTIIQRRIRFYEKLGFRKIENLEYQLKGHPYNIMVVGEEKLTPQKIIEIMTKMYQDIIRNTNWLEMKIKKN